MAFLGNLLAAGMSSGLIPNLLKGAGDVVGDIVGGLKRGEKLSPGLIAGALGRGATSTLGRVFAPKPQGEQPIRIAAPVGNSAANALPVYVPNSSGGDRVVMQPASSAAEPEYQSDAWFDEHLDEELAGTYEENADTGDAEDRANLLAKLRSYIKNKGRNASNARDVVKALAKAQKELDPPVEKPKKFRNYYPKDEAMASLRKHRH